MGLFDIGIRKEISTKKSNEEVLGFIEKKINKYSEKTVKFENGTFILNDFKTSILKYDLTINLEKSQKGFNILIDGELKQFYVLILVALVILSITLTAGIGVALVVPFAYLQKHFTTKFINSIIDKII